jgi:phospholipid/cholesterol/gamma-HCH transport system substrate-binding protein
MSTELKVGAVVLIAVAVLGAFIMRMGDTANLFGTSTEVYEVQVLFDTIAGLGRDAPVRLAGVPVGRVAEIDLTEDGQALVLLRIDNGIILRQDATASVASLGLLGEKYLEITAGTPGGPVVADGGSIQPGAAVSIDQMVAVMNDIAGDAQEMTNALSNVFGSEAGETRMAAILDNAAQLTADLGAMARTNRDAVASSISNVNELTAALRDSLPAMIENYRILADEATSMVSGNEERVAGTIDDVRELVDSLDRSAAQLEQIMEKINSGDGTASQLINTSDTVDKVNDALDNIDDSLAAFDSFFNRASQTQFAFALRSEWYGNDEATKNYFGFRWGFGASNDRALIFEVINDNIGIPIVNTVITETLNPGGEVIGVDIERITQRDDNFKFSALLAARINNWQFRGGLMESEAGIGVDYYAANDRLRFRLDGWDFGRNPDPHVKFTGQFDVWDRVFITAGADDLLSTDFRQFFVGAGFKFR